MKSADKSLEGDLFCLFNNLNIRHNNIDPADPPRYKSVVAKMKPDELERWYDETYQMCLLAFLQLEQLARKDEVQELKKSINKADT